MASTSTEASPLATISNAESSSSSEPKSSNKPRARRRASGLGGELWGDTGAPAFATLDLWREGETKPRHSKSSKKRSPKQRNQQSWLQEYKNLALQHTWLTPLILLLTILTLYIVNPQPSNRLHKLLFLSYALPSTPGTPTQYGKGPYDLLFVAFYVLLLTFTRESIMQLLLRPLALHFHISSRSKQLRFMEQSYTALYFGLLGPIGLSIMSRTPVWYFNIAGMYADFPHRTMSGEFKAYYLFQAAYWAQQAIVIGLVLEKPRKDFWQLVGHHIVTLVLIAASYRFHFTYMGLGVFVTHDLSDCFFAISKTLHYINSRFTAPYFILFIGAWAYLRHYLNLRILLSEFYEFKTVGPYELDWATEQYKCELSHWISTVLLGGLQMLNLYWGFLILRVAWRFGVKGELADERSEDEDEEEKEGEGVESAARMVAVEARRDERREVPGMRRGAMPKRRAR
ncbi:longevity assurance proteins LAG1/LAC1 [Stipitochalara longipes BDJ]|nr:longevity assurance proteins LAG1/LAC1 [Stipitochalara longipes BDJ]